MSKQKHTKLAAISVLSIIAFLAGLTLDVLYFVLPIFKDETYAQLGIICLFMGAVIAVLGLVFVIVCIVSYKRLDAKEARAAAKAKQPQQVAATQVRYIPNRETFEFINMGQYQTLDEKFDQIAKMDKTQFVIYVARLFSRKGYQVKLTPVVDNHDIDLLVEKLGVTIAVGCLLTNKVLCKEDIVRVKQGRFYYGVNNCMALTNMYFDRTALEYAKAERMSLVDRNILAEDFIN